MFLVTLFGNHVHFRYLIVSYVLFLYTVFEITDDFQMDLFDQYMDLLTLLNEQDGIQGHFLCRF